MTHTITNEQNQSSYIANEGESILAAALRNGHMYSYGCQSGVCGACKATVVSGEIDYGNSDPSTLTEADKSAGQCLLCQGIPLSDVVISVKEIEVANSIEIKTMPTRVSQKILLAPDVVQLFLTLPKTQTLNFLPGQYLQIQLKDGKHRSFSIGNNVTSAKENGLELHIRIVPDGHYSPFVLEHLNVKDILRIQAPFGTYFLRTDESRPIIMVAGGTGFAPIKGLIEEAIEIGHGQPIHLFWGARAKADLYLDDLAIQWAQDHDFISYTPVLSGVTEDDSWQGETGFVHEAVARAYDDVSDYSVYASGPPIMTDSVLGALKSKNLNTDFYHSDAFDYAAVSE
ncbi:MAG: CDP-4-dehydro-6-deoxyglucose reductase [Saprospiraceae bacterium]|jgi:CDP-4-dehydro-6-deoxyglucose reductase